MNPPGRLARRLGTTDAVVIGLGAMIGAGVFSAFAPAAAAAGSGLLIALAVAAVVAYCNARSSAQLAACYPESGGSYVYGRQRLGHWWGFTAGWAFVLGKTASCAAMALTFGAYVSPAYARPIGAAAVLVVAAVNHAGITRTAGLARVLLAGTGMALAVVLVATLAGGGMSPSTVELPGAGPAEVLRAAALLFFAFAGYARIGTLGEEVRDPARTIPRAVTVAFAVVLVLYAVVGVTVLLALGPAALARSAAPLADAARTGSLAGLAPAATVGAAVGGLGALLALFAGVGRTTLAMARRHDLPGWLAAVHPRNRIPHRAGGVLALVVCAIVLTVDLRGAIGFSSFGVLVYYGIANASAYTLRAGPAATARAVLGLAGCLALAFALPPATVLSGLAMLGAGVAGRLIVRRFTVHGGQQRRR